MEGEEAAWEDLEEIYIPAANEGRLPLRLYSFVPLTTWWVGDGGAAGERGRVEPGGIPHGSSGLPAEIAHPMPAKNTPPQDGSLVPANVHHCCLPFSQAAHGGAGAAPGHSPSGRHALLGGRQGVCRWVGGRYSGALGGGVLVQAGLAQRRSARVLPTCQPINLGI